MRRRAVALLVLLALVALLAFGITKAVGWARDALTPAAKPNPTPSTPAPEACSPTSLEMQLAAQDAQATVGGDAVLTVTNTGAAPCTLQAGPEHLVLRVTSGGQPVWGSDVCTSTTTNRPLLLDAGAASDITMRWDGTVATDICGTSRPAATPGTYRYAVVLDGRLFAEDTFVVTAQAPQSDGEAADKPSDGATDTASSDPTAGPTENPAEKPTDG